MYKVETNNQIFGIVSHNVKKHWELLFDSHEVYVSQALAIVQHSRKIEEWAFAIPR